MGDCQVDLRRHNVVGFAARICLCTAGALSLVPTLVPLLRSARELITAARQQPAWLEHSAGAFWQALVRHSKGLQGPQPVEPDARQAAQLSSRFLEEARRRLQSDPTAPLPLGPMALALHVSPRTLQSHLRQELDASPRQARESLRSELRRQR